MRKATYAELNNLLSVHRQMVGRLDKERDELREQPRIAESEARIAEEVHQDYIRDLKAGKERAERKLLETEACFVITLKALAAQIDDLERSLLNQSADRG